MVGIAVGVVVALIGLEQLAFYNRVLPGVHVDGVDVDTKTEDAARKAITAHAEALETEPIDVTFGDQQRALDPRDVDLEVDVDTTVERARDAGRRDLDAWEVVKSPFERIVSGDDVPLRVSWDHDKVVATLVDWEAHGVSGYTAGDVVFEGTTAVPVRPTPGTTVDPVAALAPLEAALASGTRTTVALPTRSCRPAGDRRRGAARGRCRDGAAQCAVRDRPRVHARHRHAGTTRVRTRRRRANPTAPTSHWPWIRPASAPRSVTRPARSRRPPSTPASS